MSTSSFSERGAFGHSAASFSAASRRMCFITFAAPSSSSANEERLIQNGWLGALTLTPPKAYRSGKCHCVDLEFRSRRRSSSYGRRDRRSWLSPVAGGCPRRRWAKFGEEKNLLHC